MKKILLFSIIQTLVTLKLTAQEEDSTLNGIIPGEARELILFDNNGFIFSAYMRFGLHRNAQANMIEGAGWWNVQYGYSDFSGGNDIAIKAGSKHGFI